MHSENKLQIDLQPLWYDDTGSLIGDDHTPPFLAAKNVQPFIDRYITVATIPVGLR